MNTIYSSSADTVGYILTGGLFQFIGGKQSLFISFACSALSGLALLSVDSTYTILSPFFLFGARLGVAAAYNVVYIVNVIIFPVELKTTSFGICNFFARIAGIMAPQAAEVD